MESLAMQNCESRNCQFSRKSRNIQNCFWRPSSQFTSLTWISMTLEDGRFVADKSLKSLNEAAADVSKHFQTSLSWERMCLKSQPTKILQSPLGWEGSGDQKVLVLFSLLFRAGKLDMKLKQDGRRSSKPSYFCFISGKGIAFNLTQTFLVLCS